MENKEHININSDTGEVEVEQQGKPPKKLKLNRIEKFIIKITPPPVKRFINWLLDRLPQRMSNWIRRHSFLTICIVYTIRGLFFRPIMWPVYAAIAAYFGYKD